MRTYEVINILRAANMQVLADEVRMTENLEHLEQLEDGNLGMTSIRLRF